MKKFEAGSTKARVVLEFDERQFVSNHERDVAVNALVAEALAALNIDTTAVEAETKPVKVTGKVLGV